MRNNTRAPAEPGSVGKRLSAVSLLGIDLSSCVAAVPRAEQVLAQVHIILCKRQTVSREQLLPYTFPHLGGKVSRGSIPVNHIERLDFLLVLPVPCLVAVMAKILYSTDRLFCLMYSPWVDWIVQ